MYQASVKFDIERLRKDLLNESYGAYFGGGFGAALIDAVDVEHASQEKLLEIAKSRGIEVDKYEIRKY